MPDYPPEIWNQIDELTAGSVPEHVAIIMDGNSRWARQHGHELSRGHREGVHSVQAIADLCGEIEDVKILTLYAFSTENWGRSDQEIGTLMELLKEFLRKEVNRMMEQNVRFETIGDVGVFPEDVREEIKRTKELTEDNREFRLNLALNYGGRDEITRAVKSIAHRVADGELAPSQIDEDTVAGQLDTSHLPDPDFLIRTSGEQRVSNFLLWQIAYTEILYTETLWPDFREENFLDALFEFQERERRYGRRPAREE
jgi:undecaprenyl diphosphate synthase